MIFNGNLDSLTADQLRRLLSLSERQVRNLRTAGLPSRGHGTKRRYAWDETFAFYLNRKLADLAPKSRKPQDEEWARTLKEQMTRKVKAEAERTEIKLAKERGEVVVVEDVKQAQIKVNLIIRNRLLGIPSKLSPLAANKPMTELKSILEREIREVLTNLSNADLAST